MYSFQVARKSEGNYVHVDEYLTEMPLTVEQKRELVGKDSMLRDTREVPIAPFKTESEFLHYRENLLKWELESTKALVLAGMSS
jgi:hypothetical protein